MPIFKAKKLILAGDPLQLPPTILSLDKERKKKDKKKAVKGSKATTVKAKDPKSKPCSSKSASQKDSPSNGSNEDEGAEADGDGTGEDEDQELEEGQTLEDDVSLKPRWPVELRPPHTLETTLFDRLERMYGPGIKRMLRVQYRCALSLRNPSLELTLHSLRRMHDQICDFPSKTLYQSKLKSHPSVASHLLKDLPNADPDADDDEVLHHPVVFFDTSG